MAGEHLKNKQVQPEDSPFLKHWEFKKYSKMKLGLRLLMVGFSFQFVSLWIYLPLPSIATSAVIMDTTIKEKPVTIREPDSIMPPNGIKKRPATHKKNIDQ